jgi:hypothetical protein
MKTQPLTLFAVLALSLPAFAGSKDTAEVFTDKGETFIRAGSRQGLVKGSKVTILGDRIGDTQERREVGSASILESWPDLARVSLDSGAAAATGERVAKLAKQEHAKAKVAAPLKGKAERSLGRIIVYNQSPNNWSDCELRIADQKHTKLPKLEANDHETFLSAKFGKDEFKKEDVPADMLLVRCKEGESKFKL